MKRDLSGVWAPLVTPIGSKGAIDHGLLARHARRVLSSGCRGVLLFGTTGEAPSFTVKERLRALEALLDERIDPERVMVGTGCCAAADTLALSSHAAEFGVAALLVLPPFYFKGVSDEGLFRSFASLVEACRMHAPRLLLYHFPRLSGVPVSTALARRLVEAFPGSIVGVKDSSGDPASARAFVDACEGFAVFPGTESVLPALRTIAINGCISAGANVHGHALARAWARRGEGETPDESQALRLRAILDAYPMIAALKALLAAREADEAEQWRALRPPLVPLEGKGADDLVAAYSASCAS